MKYNFKLIKNVHGRLIYLVSLAYTNERLKRILNALDMKLENTKYVYEFI